MQYPAPALRAGCFARVSLLVIALVFHPRHFNVTGWENVPDQHKVVLKLRNKYSAMRRIVESGATFEERIAPKVRRASGGTVGSHFPAIYLSARQAVISGLAAGRMRHNCPRF